MTTTRRLLRHRTYAGAVRRLRLGVRRISGPLARRRSGWFFVSSRAVLRRLERLARRTPLAPGIDPVSLAALPSRVPGAEYRELEARPEPVVPPRGWVWPTTFVQIPHRYPGPRHGSGVVAIPGGVVFGSEGHFGPDPRGVLAEACVLWPEGEHRALRDATRALAAGLVDLDGVTTSVWANGTNYAHCLLQSIPRLALLRRAFGLDADRCLVNAAAAPATFEALARLGIAPDRLHLVPARHGPAYRCEALRAATSPPIDDFGVDWSVAFLHELFLPAPPEHVVAGRRLYVRRGVTRRAVLNEEEVLAALAPWGFETVTMDGRTVREQASMFASAEVVVAPHGAALANLVFARPGTPVIELMGRNTSSTAFAFLAWRRNLEYRIVMGTEPSLPRPWWTWEIEADTVVDVRELRRCLEGLALP